MTLAGMIRLDEDALICDFAETYHILDFRSLPLRTAATLSAGFRDNARIKLKAAGTPVPLETILLAAISDRIDAIKYGLSSEADRKQKPVSLVESILGEQQAETKNKTGAMSFASVDDFNKALARAQGVE